MLRVKKIKVVNTERGATKISANYEKVLPNDDFDEFSFTSSDEPLDSFRAALQAVVPFVLNILDVDNTWDEDLMTVTGVSFSHAQKKMGVVVIAQKVVSRGGIFNINTPHFVFDEEGDAWDKVIEGYYKLFLNLQAESLRYIQGDRKNTQLSLPSLVHQEPDSYDAGLQQARFLAEKFGFEVRELVRSRR